MLKLNHLDRALRYEARMEELKNREKVGAGDTAKCHECGCANGYHDKRCSGYLVDPETGEPIPTHNAK